MGAEGVALAFFLAYFCSFISSSSGSGRLEILRNQRPTLVVSPDVSTSVKEILIGNVLLFETFLVKFLPAPEPFPRKDALG